jgi:hypothetical protein
MRPELDYCIIHILLRGALPQAFPSRYGGLVPFLFVCFCEQTYIAAKLKMPSTVVEGICAQNWIPKSLAVNYLPKKCVKFVSDKTKNQVKSSFSPFRPFSTFYISNVSEFCI